MPANKRADGEADAKGNKGGATEPKFPYTTKPSSLRKLLQSIPQKPKPSKFDKPLLKSWGFTDNNDYTVVRVLKAVGLLGSNNEPSDLYTRYMHLGTGPAVLADPIRRLYGPLFQASHTPYKESSETLQNLFNIHSGGGQASLEKQIQTFKALCESTSFDAVVTQPDQGVPPTGASGGAQANGGQGTPLATGVHINLHIHLPENKSRRDYEAIIEDIGRYIFGRTGLGDQNE